MGNGHKPLRGQEKKAPEQREPEPTRGQETPARIDLSQTIPRPIVASSTYVRPPIEGIKALENYQKSLTGLVDSNITKVENIDNLDSFCKNLIEAKQSLLNDFSNKKDRAEELAKNRIFFTGESSGETTWISFDWVKTGIDDNGRVFVVVSDRGTVTRAGPEESAEMQDNIRRGKPNFPTRAVGPNEIDGLKYYFDQQGISLFTETEVAKSRYSRPSEGALWLFTGEKLQGGVEQQQTWVFSESFSRDKLAGVLNNSRILAETQASQLYHYNLARFAKADEKGEVVTDENGRIQYSSMPQEAIATGKGNSYISRLALEGITLEREYEQHLLMLSDSKRMLDSLKEYYEQNPIRGSGGFDISSEEGTGALEGLAKGKKTANFAALCPKDASWVGTMNVIFTPVGGAEEKRKFAVAYSETEGYVIMNPWAGTGFRGIGKTVKEAMKDLMEGGTYFGLISSVGAYYYEDFSLKKEGTGYRKESGDISMVFTHEKYADLDGLIRNLDKCASKLNVPAMGAMFIPIPHRMIPMLVVWGYEVLEKATYDQYKAIHHLGSNYEIGRVAMSAASYAVIGYVSSSAGGKAIQGLAGLAAEGKGMTGFLSALSKNPAVLNGVVDVSANGLMAADVYVNTRSELGRLSEETSSSYVDWKTGKDKLDAAYYQALEIRETQGLGAALEFLKSRGFSDPTEGLEKLGKTGDYPQMKRDLYAHFFGKGAQDDPLNERYVDAVLSRRANEMARYSDKDLTALSASLEVSRDTLIKDYFLLNGGPADSVNDILVVPSVERLSRKIAGSAIARLPKGLVGIDADSLAKSLTEDYAHGYWSLDWGKARAND